MSNTNNLLGLQNMQNRLRKTPNQQDRMIQDKLNTMRQATKYSYQGARIQLIDGTEIYPALINKDLTEFSYDDKILSVDFKFGIKPGSVFTWLNTDTIWLSYSQDLTELAYFKGKIRKCNYIISWENENKESKSTYAAVQNSSVEEIANMRKYSSASIDVPNYQITVYMPRNEDTLAYFQRYSKFYLKGLETDVCWRVVYSDIINSTGVIKIIADEYYSNPQVDDLDNDVVGGLVVKPIDTVTGEISGKTIIKPLQNYTYTYKGSSSSDWSIISSMPVKTISKTATSITLQWTDTHTGSFRLHKGSTTIDITVESLF